MGIGNGYFDIKRGIDIEKDGGFWCYACLAGKPAEERSPDMRYCQGCYDFLLKEAEMLPATKRPAWIPKSQKPQTAQEKQYQVSGVGDGIMSTLGSKNFKVDIIHLPVASRTSGKRGPKHRQLPEDVINQLAAEGMGSKAIAAKLKVAYGIVISYKTIQRVLSGKRTQLVLGKVAD